MLICTIHPTSFDYGSSLNVNKEMSHTFYRTVYSAYNDRHNGEFNRYSTFMHCSTA